MFFKRKPELDPRPDPLAIFCSTVDQALRDATAGAENWPLKVRLAKALEDFAGAVRLEIATKRPL